LCQEFWSFKEQAMVDPQDQLFTKLRGIIGGYLVDLILEEGGEASHAWFAKGWMPRRGWSPRTMRK
jgi:hypothetical protein